MRAVSGGVSLAVRRWRRAGAPVLVLVHGFPDNASMWQPCAESLARRFEVAAYDVRGAGSSDKPAALAAYCLERLVEDLGAVLDQVSPDRPVHLLTHDWGSVQCWEAVCAENLAQRIASFTSISGPCLDHVGYWLRERLKTRSGIAQVLRQARRSWYVAAFHLPGAAWVWRAGLARRWPRLLSRFEDTPLSAHVSAEDAKHGVLLYRANVCERLRHPRERRTMVPVQLIVPTRDPFVGAELYDDLARWAPLLWRRELAAGHWLPRSQPEALARMVEEFVDFIGGSTESQALKRARAGSAA